MAAPRNFPRDVQPALTPAAIANDSTALQVKADVVDMTPQQPEEEIQIEFDHIQAQANGQGGAVAQEGQ
ncbi:hypothetical protein BGX26_008405 [Mortierella sp. AD094]|nr:hypothetical protein BGX26_008405 [Mortierella sp. AD094]